MIKISYRTSLVVAVLFMFSCILVGITLGNKNALNQATTEAARQSYGLYEALNARINYAEKLEVIISRNLPNSDSVTNLRKSLRDAIELTDLSNIVSIDDELLKAIERSCQEMILEKSLLQREKNLSEAIRKEMSMITRAFAQALNIYNQTYEEAGKIYDKLPMRFLFQDPREQKLN